MSGAVAGSYLRRVLNQPVPAAPPRDPRSAAEALHSGVVALDAAQVIAVGIVSARLFPDVEAAVSAEQVAGLAAVAAASAAALRRTLRGGGGARLPEPAASQAWRASLAVAAALGIAMAWCVLLLPAPRSVLAWVAVWMAVSVATAAALRYVAARLIERAGGAALRVAVVGRAEETEPLAQAAASGAAPCWRLAARIRDESPEDIDRLRALVELGELDMAVLLMRSVDTCRVKKVCEAVADSPVRICLGLDVGVPFAASALGKLPLVDVPLVDIMADPHDGLRGALKRALDLSIASLAFMAVLPLLLLAALAIWIESPGPVLFRQWRFGIGSRPIQILKLRTMRTDQGDVTGTRRTVRRDPRVTRVGRWMRRTSVDELPQLINVLRGEMSLVGPRAHPMYMKVGGAYYFEAVEHYCARHRVRPGITGWAQVNGSRGEVDTLEKARRRVDLDLWYVSNWSIRLDLAILLRTALGGFASLKAD